MKVKFIHIGVDEKFIYDGKAVKVGDIIDIPKDRAESLVIRNKAVFVKEKLKNSESK